MKQFQLKIFLLLCLLSSAGSTWAVESKTYGYSLGEELIKSSDLSKLSEGALVAFYCNGFPERRGFLYEGSSNQLFISKDVFSSIAQSQAATFKVHRTSLGIQLQAASGQYIDSTIVTNAIGDNLSVTYSGKDSIFYIQNSHGKYFNANQYLFTYFTKAGNYSPE